MKKRDDGRWQERISLGRESTTGKYQYKYFYGATKKETAEKVAAFQADLHIYGKPVENTKITLAKWGYIYLFEVAKPRLEKSTFHNKMSIYNNHILNSPLGNMAVKDIQPIHIQNYFNGKTDYSKGTLKLIREMMKLFLDSAVDNNIIRINPIQKVKLPVSTVKKKEIEIFTLEEQKAYLAALKQSKYYMPFLTALYTGMRQGEIIALKWKNVDLQNSEIFVCESYKYVLDYLDDGSTKPIINKKNPKTESGKRTIPIPRFLTQKLIEYKLNSFATIENLVFTTISGTPLSAGSMLKGHKSVCRQAKIRETSFHSLRHTFATRAIESGADIKTLSKILGHTDVVITLRTYVHSTYESKKQIADAMDRLYQSMG